jgi:L-asparaginase
LRGLIVAATGNGTLHRELEAGLERATRAGVVVRRVTRCPEGAIDDRERRWDASTMPSAAKARVELMLDLPLRHP